MRIALVGNWPRPYGGVSVHVAALARALRARGADVLVLDIGHGDHSGEGVRPARGPVRYAAALAGAVAGGRLLHVHTNGANWKSWAVAWGAALASRAGGPRPVLTLHSGSAPSFLARGRIRRAVAARACAGFGAVVAVNDEIAASLADAGIPRERVVVLPAFFEGVLEPGAPPAALAAFRARHAPLLAADLPAGAVYGADLLLPAFAALRAASPGAGLVAFGAGSERLDAPGVLGLGELDHAAVLAVMAAADVFVRPTRADGDAVSVREALALGCRVVASDVGHRPPGCLLFPRDDAGALARLLAATAAPRARAATGGAAREAGDAGDASPLDALWSLYARERARARRRRPGRAGRTAPHAGG